MIEGMRRTLTAGTRRTLTERITLTEDEVNCGDVRRTLTEERRRTWIEGMRRIPAEVMRRISTRRGGGRILAVF